jgi:hypothetical protein
MNQIDMIEEYSVSHEVGVRQNLNILEALLLSISSKGHHCTNEIDKLYGKAENEAKNRFLAQWNLRYRIRFLIRMGQPNSEALIGGNRAGQV